MAVPPIDPDLVAKIMRDPGARGYVVAYHVGDPPDCPGCGRSNWIVGRQLAECAFCSTALPIVSRAA
jgi:hypothetical protein